MKKKAASKSAFFNLRVLIGLVAVLGAVLLALLAFGTFSNASAQANVGSSTGSGGDQEPNGQMMVIPALHSDLSRPLREQPVVWPQPEEQHEAHVHPKIPIKHTDAPDPVIQSSFWQPLMTMPSIPGPIRQWAGIGKPCDGCGTEPSDTNGAVGKTQYVELVNIALQVFDKFTGTSLLGPVPIGSLWSGFGGACETRGNGDPVVAYDQLADRWIISQFARPSGVNWEQNECIAVSETGDATGAWYRYDFHLTSKFQDYPKLGVWPDGYYMAASMYTNNTPTGRYLGPQPFVFDRAKMLVGDPTATSQTTRAGPLGDTETLLLPSYLDGILPPPLGDPNHFVEFPQGNPLIYKVWDFHVDWDRPANSSFRHQASVPAADFTRLCPDTDACVPQRAVSQSDWLNGIADRLMFRNAYRRFPGGGESMLNNFTVKAFSVAGIRWFELRRTPQTSWTLRQESTYRPDGIWRWMGSIASDNKGNIALGFSASSNFLYPQIRYAGRLATDPLSILSGEQHLFDGTGSQEQTNNRWGDYSDMTVDPVDDCTFYYTNQYYERTAVSLWRTRIGYFRFARCTAPQKGTGHFLVTACIGGASVRNASVSIDGRLYGVTLSNGTYDAVLPPGSHSYAVSKPPFATQRGNFTIINGQTTGVEICLGRQQ